MTDQVVFLLLIVILSALTYLLSFRFLEEYRKLFCRIINLTPSFEGTRRAELMSFLFCSVLMLFILGVMMIIFD